MEFELGRTYSGYKFLDVVRRSRNLVQYRVQNTLAQRLENLQTLPTAATDDQEASERFLREVRIRARLQHPHVVSFYTALPVEGRMVMTTELYDGLPLAERLQLGPLPWREALVVASQILDVLTCLHQQSFVHCDITPDNIQFGPEGFCKLSNFAQTRPLGVAHAPESGAVVGNPKYISPEQVKGGRELDQRSDLYSLTAVLYEMLCGKPPFESRSQFELMLAHVNQSPLPPSQVNPAVPEFLDAVVLRGLAKEPADRYATAQEFSEALNAAGSGGATVEAVELQEAVGTADVDVFEPEVIAEAPPVEVEAVAAAPEVEVEAVAVEPEVIAEIAEPVVEAAAVEE
jgi:serine/threonine-protein kinase